MGDSGKGVKLIQFTDLHLGESAGDRVRGIDADRGYLGAIDHAREDLETADGVLITGDLTQDTGEAAYYRVLEVEGYTSAPVRVIPGNHDDPELMRDLFARGRTRMAPELRLGHWGTFFVNSSIPGQTHGRVDSASLGQLQELLRRSDMEHLLVVLHHHPVAAGSAWLDGLGLENGGALFEVLGNDPRVRGVVWGHVHQEVDTHYRDIRLLATPATCVQFAPKSDRFALDQRLPGYRLLHLEPDGAIRTEVRRYHPRIRELVSGGQTGVDQGALEAAMDLGLPHDGWCPKGRRSEAGPIPVRFRLRETESGNYPERTALNIRDSDGTLILASGPLSGGTALTARLAEDTGRPVRVLDVDDPIDFAAFEDWIDLNRIRRLNVAGPRESGSPGIQARTREVVKTLLTGVNGRGEPVGIS